MITGLLSLVGREKGDGPPCDEEHDKDGLEERDSLDLVGIQYCIILALRPNFEKMNNSKKTRRRILITGARGKLATQAIPRLREHFDLRLSDIFPKRLGGG